MNSESTSEDEQPKCILIPFLKMSGEQLVCTPDQEFDGSLCELIDRYPSEKNAHYPDIRIRKSYIMSYNNETKNAKWVYEILNNDTLKINCKENGSFGKNEFEGYEQGHLAAAANHRWCQEAYHDTFLMSNMTPQLEEVNNSFMKIVENFCRKKAIDENVRNVHVYTGPLYLKFVRGKYVVLEPEKEEKPGKKIPTHYFKVAFVEDKNGIVNLHSFVVPQIEKEEKDFPEPKVEQFVCDIVKIQKLSGLRFMESRNENTMGKIKSIKWEGENEKGMPCSVKIKVRIISPHNEE
ncbi:endonuclease G, mitochondrial-like [Sinocyclocheilus anshuiensis]|uniref:endonuclease G, mitochondrial-like n=1 Tax=Sinocyclocheilus anshuiensis TaxID=1608454 RepID=UPI0007B917A3|nr:PREDICTED: endonuclease G, mitochondrial-like [Sinocyclocheilus anshuiensis]